MVPEVGTTATVELTRIGLPSLASEILAMTSYVVDQDQ